MVGSADVEEGEVPSRCCCCLISWLPWQRLLVTAEPQPPSTAVTISVSTIASTIIASASAIGDGTMAATAARNDAELRLAAGIVTAVFNGDGGGGLVEGAWCLRVAAAVGGDGHCLHLVG